MSYTRGNPKPIPKLPPAPANVPPGMMIPVDDGATTFRITVAQLSYAVGQVPDALRAPGLGAIPRSLASKAAEVVSVLDYGAKGDGATDDTAAFQAALNSGRSVIVPPLGYVLSGTLDLTTSRQRLSGPGARLQLVGSGSVFRVSGNRVRGVTIEGFEVDGSQRGSGWLLEVSGGDQVTLRDIAGAGLWQGVYAESADDLGIENVRLDGVRGPVGLHWYGDATKRSRRLNIRRVFLDMSAGRGTGLIWDGNCRILNISGLSMFRPGTGVIQRMTTGGVVPFYAFVDGLEIDTPQGNGWHVQAGGHVHFSPGIFISGSETGSGVQINSGVTGNSVVFSGGRVGENARYGIENAVSIAGGNPLFVSNVLGDISGTNIMKAGRFQVDPNGYLSLSTGGDVFLGFDANDFFQFERANNLLYFRIAAGNVQRWGADGIRNYKPMYFEGVTFANLPAANTLAGFTYRLTDRSQRMVTSDGTNWRFVGDGSVAT